MNSSKIFTIHWAITSVNFWRPTNIAASTPWLQSKTAVNILGKLQTHTSTATAPFPLFLRHAFALEKWTPDEWSIKYRRVPRRKPNRTIAAFDSASFGNNWIHFIHTMIQWRIHYSFFSRFVPLVIATIYQLMNWSALFVGKSRIYTDAYRKTDTQSTSHVAFRWLGIFLKSTSHLFLICFFCRIVFPFPFICRNLHFASHSVIRTLFAVYCSWASIRMRIHLRTCLKAQRRRNACGELNGLFLRPQQFCALQCIRKHEQGRRVLLYRIPMLGRDIFAADFCGQSIRVEISRETKRNESEKC